MNSPFDGPAARFYGVWSDPILYLIGPRLLQEQVIFYVVD